MSAASTITLDPGTVLADKYEVLSLLGSGWEGQVYKVRELETQIERAAKLFFPERNLRNRSVVNYAQKLHRLRRCSEIISYVSCEQVEHEEQVMTLFISEYVDGEMLTEHLARYRGGRIPPFQALHLLHALARAVERIHKMGEYHGDLHSDNVIVQGVGLHYDIKLLDFFHWGKSTQSNRQYDIVSIIRIFYDALGGRKYYSTHPRWVREICCGLRQSLILRKYKTSGDLLLHLEGLRL